MLCTGDVTGNIGYHAQSALGNNFLPNALPGCPGPSFKSSLERKAVKQLIALLFLLAPLYLVTVRPWILLGRLREAARDGDGTGIKLTEAVATAPMPMVKYRNRLFPRLYVFDNRIEYHILTNRSLAFEDIESATLGNKSVTKFILNIVTRGERQTTLTFIMREPAAERCAAALAPMGLKDIRFKIER